MTKNSEHPNNNYRLRKYKDILNFIEKLSIPDREKLIDKIQIENYFIEYANSEVVIEWVNPMRLVSK